MEHINLTSKQLIDLLEWEDNLNEWDEIEEEVIYQYVIPGRYTKSKNGFYVKVKDGLLRIPYGYTNDNDNFTSYSILLLSAAKLLTKEEKELYIKSLEEKIKMFAWDGE